MSTCHDFKIVVRIHLILWLLNMAASSNRNEEEEEWNKCVNNFQGAASFQGRFAYLLMSIHFVNPRILNR